MNKIKEILLYGAVEPFEPFRYFFLSALLLSILSLVFKDQLAAYPGYLPVTIAGHGLGASRFLVDAYFPIMLLYLSVLIARLNPERIAAVNHAVRTNKYAKHPLTLAVLVLVLAVYLYSMPHSMPVNRFFNINKFYNLLLGVPMFCYSTIQSIAILLCRALEAKPAANQPVSSVSTEVSLDS